MRQGKYWGYVGGCNAMTNGGWREINGYSNRFWGWGCEDDAIWVKATLQHGFALQYAPHAGQGTHLGTDHMKNYSGMARNILDQLMGPQHDYLFNGDGISRLRSEPRPHWTVAPSTIDPRIKLVSVDLTDFQPCPNGEVLPHLLPCNSKPKATPKNRHNLPSRSPNHQTNTDISYFTEKSLSLSLKSPLPHFSLRGQSWFTLSRELQHDLP